jgi:hypothetical protein
MIRAIGFTFGVVFGGLTAIALFFAVVVGIAYLFGAEL